MSFFTLGSPPFRSEDSGYPAEDLEVAGSGREKRLVRECPEPAADERPHDRDPRVIPVRVSLARNRKYGVCDPRREVARRIDRVAGRPAEREADGEDQQADEEGHDGLAESHRQRCLPDAARGSRGEVPDEEEHPEEQHERADDLGQQVLAFLADRRRSAEDGQLEARVLRLSPVWQVGDVDQDRTDERPDHLAGYVLGHVVPRRDVSQREAERHRRIEVRAAELADRIHGHRDRHSPSERDHDPACALGLRVREQDSGHDTVSEQDQDRGPDHLGSADFHDTPFRVRPRRRPSRMLISKSTRLRTRFGVLEIQTREMSTAYRWRSARAMWSSPPIRKSAYG